MIDVQPERFEALVAEALDGIPEDLGRRMDNVIVQVKDRAPDRHLLGLYEGIPLTERGGAYNMILPDKITLFQRSLEAVCPDDETLRREVQVTVVHEIAHHFGISDRRLAELGWA